MKRSKNKILFALLMIAFVSAPMLASAQSWWPIVPCGIGAPGADPYPGTPWNESYDCGRCDIFRLTNNVLNFILQAVTPVFAVLMFFWAGFIYVTSAGRPGRMSQAKNIFFNTFIAVAIILGAWLIANTLMNQLNIGGWNSFQCTSGFPFNTPPNP